MRIIGGKLKGRVIRPGKKFSARPTTDLAKESLFNILQNRYNFEELDVLDLFSGTGSIGFEFASRECKSVTMVEKNHQHFGFIKNTATDLGLDEVKIIKNDVFKFIEMTKNQYDLVFADPPFELKFLTEIPDRVFKGSLLAENSILILEHPKSYDFSEHKYFIENRKYGHVNFSFFQKRED